MIIKEVKQKIISDIKVHERDTGSPVEASSIID